MRPGQHHVTRSSNNVNRGTEMRKRIVLTGLAGLLAAVVWAFGAASATATPPGENGLLTFASERDGNSEIYVATADGTTQVRLTDDPAADTDPAFSPDGTKIAFVSDRDGDREIYVMNADGTGQTRITDRPGDDMDPAWSPDGSRLAIRRNVEGNNEIFLIDAADGGNPVNLTDNEPSHSDFLPDWSPDGEKIAYQRYRSGSGDGFGNEVMLINADGTGQVNLTSNDNSINDGRPSFSPDGTRIAFDSNRSGSFEIYTMDTEGGDLDRLTDIADGQSQEAAFSPDGELVAFRAASPPAGNGISVVPATGGDATAVTAGTADSSPAWETVEPRPATTITDGPTGTVGQTDATFVFASDTEDATFECRLDPVDASEDAPATEWSPCESPHSIEELEDGSHTFEVRATGPDERTGDPAVRTWEVDTVPPVVEITGHPDASTRSDSATFDYTVDDPEATVECTLDPGPDPVWEACAEPAVYSDLASGEHTFRLRATDDAGNRSVPAVFTWEVDRIAPVVTIESGPPAHTQATDATIEFSIDDPEATAECRLDSADEEAWEACETPFEAAGLTEGDHRLEIRATDPLGNQDAPTVRAWTVDTTAPTVTIDQAPPALNASVNAAFEFSGDEPGLTAECRIDPPETADEGWEECESPVGYTNLADGSHRFEVRVSDPAGNVSEPASHEWEVATVKPVATIVSGPAPLTAEDEASFELESDDPAATFECRLDPVEQTDDAPATGWDACESPAGYTDLADGPHAFEVRATETDQGTGPVATWEWTVDTTAPTVEITGAPAPISGTADPVFGFTSDEAGTTAECRLDPVDESDPWIGCVSPMAYTGLSEAEHRFEVRVTDQVGHVSEPAVHAWIVETTPPGVTITSGPESPTTEISAWFGFDSENANATFECRIDGSDWAACESGVGYGQLEDGEHRFDVRAVGQGAGPGPVESRTWTVDTAVPRLTITSGPSNPTNEVDATFELSMNKPGFSFRCQLDAEPAGPCPSPLTYAGLAAGDHSLLVEALDADDEVVDSGLWQWTILADRPVAAITDGPAAASSSATGLFRFEADVPEATFECRIVGSGSGWRACTSPAAFSGLADGPHTFEVRAVLPGSQPGPSADRGWTVDTTPPEVSLAGGPGAVTSAGSATFTIAVGEPGATTECRLDEGAWTGCADQVTYDDLADGEHVLRVRAIDAVGNTGFARRDWTVDRTPPMTTLTAVPDASTTAFQARFEFAADEPVTGFECRIDGGEWKACSSAHRITGLGRGAHDFAVRATDRVGNVGQPAAHRWRIVAPKPKGLVPRVQLKRRVRLDRDGTGNLATVKCPEGRCRVKAPKRVAFRIRGKRFTPGIKTPRNFYRERANGIMLITSPRARRMIRRHGPARVRVRLTVISDNGKRSRVGSVVRLVAGR